MADRVDARVYHYAGAAVRLDGSQTATSTFALAEADQHPEGIADPSPSEGGALQLGFDSLPSAQGWTYVNFGTPAPEDRVFSVSGGVLHQNTIGVGIAGQGQNSYHYNHEIINESFPFTITVKARVLQDEGGVLLLTNPFGFSFGAYLCAESYGIGLSTNRVSLNGDTIITNIDNTRFHDYRLLVTPGAGYQLFVDNVLMGSGPPRFGSFSDMFGDQPGSLFLGDGTAGPNALADVTFYRFSQDLPYSVQVNATAPGTQLRAGSEALIEGHAESVRDGDAATRGITAVTVNGVPVDALDVVGNFFAKVAVAPGQNNFAIVATDVGGTAGSTTVTFNGDQPQAGTIDFTNFSDVSASFTGDYARTSFNEDTKTLYADLRVRNAGQYPADAPLIVGVKNISDPTVRAVGFDGVMPDGTPYFDFTKLMAGKTLAPGGTTDYQSLQFLDPNRSQFTYDLVFLGKLNQPPAITSVPVVDAIAGRSLLLRRHRDRSRRRPADLLAHDRPAAMQVDPASGQVTWSPTTDDLGTHNITLRVDDGRGGYATQTYVINVTTPPPNRPPLLHLGAGGRCQRQHRLCLPGRRRPTRTGIRSRSRSRPAPAGLQIDPQTGLVSWTPTYQQLGPQNVSLTVADGHGGTATQSFAILVQQEPGNHPPVIISQPVTTAVAGQTYTYPVKAIDPDNDPLTYSLTTAPTGMTIDPQSGVVDWSPPTMGEKTISLNFDSLPRRKAGRTTRKTPIQKHRSSTLAKTPTGSRRYSRTRWALALRGRTPTATI